jgi:hypothetical protein
LNEPEFLVTSIDDHRIIATRKKASQLSDTLLSTLEFHCHYLGMPSSQDSWWNYYKDIKHLPLLQPYVDRTRCKISSVLANGKSFEFAAIAQLISFAKV